MKSWCLHHVLITYRPHFRCVSIDLTWHTYIGFDRETNDRLNMNVNRLCDQRKIQLKLFLPLIPETRNLPVRVKKGVMGFFSDHKSSPTRVWTVCPPWYTFYSRSWESTYVCFCGHDNWCHGWNVCSRLVLQSGRNTPIHLPSESLEGSRFVWPRTNVDNWRRTRFLLDNGGRTFVVFCLYPWRNRTRSK